MLKMLELDLRAWNEQTANYGSSIMFFRNLFVRFLNENITKFIGEISTGDESVSVKYKSSGRVATCSR